MRSSEEADRRVCVCANCGIAEVDEIKLEECDECYLVKYCGDNCKEAHREQHGEECKKWEANNKVLFNQPERSHLEECPLCFLPMPLDLGKSSFYPCCSKTVCNGCVYANMLSNGGRSCPFCREKVVSDDDEEEKRMSKRIKASDPAALCFMGKRRRDEGDFDSAFNYLTKAAELGDIDAHHNLSAMYHWGEGVERDEEKKVHHLVEAAIGGHPTARHNLGCYEGNNGGIERAVKHFIIAAKLGEERSMKTLWKHYSKGNITKDDLDATLRTHHAAINATKSQEREAAEKAGLNSANY